MNETQNTEKGVTTMAAIWALSLLAVVIFGALMFHRWFVVPKTDVAALVNAEKQKIVSQYEEQKKKSDVEIAALKKSIKDHMAVRIAQQREINKLKEQAKVIKAPQTPDELRRRFAALGYEPIELKKGEKR